MYVFFVSFILSFLPSTLVAADLAKSKLEIAAGPTSYFSSDNNPKYGLMVEFNFYTHFAFRYLSQGYKYGQTKQERYLLSAGGLMPVALFNAKQLFYAPLGLTYMLEKTQISQTKSWNKNLGIFTGMGLEFFQNSSFFLSSEWLLYVFSSGISTVFLSTANRQSFSICMGYRLK